MTNERTYWGQRERRAVEARDALYEALKVSQWISVSGTEGAYFCPTCGGGINTGHNPECIVGNTMFAVEQDTLWPINY